jgi:hypothetical protein
MDWRNSRLLLPELAEHLKLLSQQQDEEGLLFSDIEEINRQMSRELRFSIDSKK